MPARISSREPVIPGRCEASNPESRDSLMCNCTSEVWSFGPSRNDVPPPSILQPVPGLEDPPHHDHADRQKHQRDADADADTDVGDFIKTPAEAADQIDHRIE